MSTKKIEGYADGIVADRPQNSISSITLFTERRFDDLVPARLVITAEPVYTQSEVVALIEEVKVAAATNARRCYTNRIEQMTPPAPIVFEIDRIAAKHGFTTF